MICENIKKLRLELDTRQQLQLSTKITAAELELIKLHVQASKTNSKLSVQGFNVILERKHGDSEKQASNKRPKTTDGSTKLTETPTEPQPRPLFEMQPKDRQLIDEFQLESETIFAQDDVCYEHYKEIQRDQK